MTGIINRIFGIPTPVAPQVKTEIVLVLDRSGSMRSMHATLVESVNAFIDEVRKEPGEGFWTLVQFDDIPSSSGAKENFPQYLYEALPDAQVPHMRMMDFKPRGGTALIDAFCSVLRRTEDRIKEMKPEDRPRVMFYVVTDGEENASKRYTRGDMRATIARVEKEYDWKFVYVGANQDAWAEAQKYDMAKQYTIGGVQHQNCVGGGSSAGTMRHAMGGGTRMVRGWKADGNKTAEQLLGNAAKEEDKP